MKSNPSEHSDHDRVDADYTAALERVRDQLGPLAASWHFFPTIGSTNDYALTLATEGAVVVANEQTAGRGRRGHTWFSPAGSGLYVSIVLMPGRAPAAPRRATTLLTIAAGVAIAEGIESATGLRVALKWPNDLFIGRRKLAGVLAETSGSGAAAVILGYGINVGPMAYPPELRDRATSLESELGRTTDRGHVLAGTLVAMAARYRDLLDGRFDAILDAWRQRAPAAIGAAVECTTPAGVRAGTTAGVDDDGALLVRIDDRIERIVSGEIRWK